MFKTYHLGGDLLKKQKIILVGIALFGLSIVTRLNTLYVVGDTEVSAGTEVTADVTTELEVTTEISSEEVTEKTTEEPTDEMGNSEQPTEELTTEIPVSKCKYVGFVSLNNFYKNLDYKINETSRESLVDQLAFPQDTKVENVEEEDATQNLNNLSTEESWLISNNIVSRNYSFSVSGIEVTDENLYEYMPKTEFWMMLYKSVYGVLESRPVVFKEKSVRDGKEVDSIKNYEITEDGTKIDAVFEGDYWTYVSPNVYELYLKELLDKGLLDKKDFNSKNGKKFLNDYEKLSNEKVGTANVAWATELGPAYGKSKALGHSYSVEDSSEITCRKPNYFKSEKIFTIDALHDVETFLRSTEKDMSDLEASIVSYKYGITYLSNLSDEDRSTVQFLIAKGILDYEDVNSLVNLYGILDRETAYKICYRVANKDARLDFSTITLTDSETAWQAKGYGEDHISIIRASSVPYVKTVTKKELETLLNGGDVSNYKSTDPEDADETSTENDFIDDLLTLYGDPVEASAATKNYTVIKVFDSTYNYTYEGNFISKMYTDTTLRPTEITDIKSEQFSNADNSTTDVYIVTFSITAKSYKKAVLYVDNKIGLDSNLNVHQVVGYTTVKSESGEEITLISADTLRSDLSEITIVEDKVLTNKVTGMQAILLPDEGYALVGNRIIRSDTLMETDSNGTIYYNLDIICNLMSNTYLSTLTNKELYICTDLTDETTVEVVSSYGNQIGNAFISNLSVNTSESAGVSTKFYNADNLPGVSKLIREFQVKNSDGSSESVYVIVDLRYVVPTIEDNSSLQLDTLTQNDTLTIGQVNSYLNERPKSASLADWWDSNYGMTNVLCNFMYGTKNVEYVQSGYLAPSVTILRSSRISDATLSKVFTSNGFSLDATTKKYCKSSNKWWKFYYNSSNMSTVYLQGLADAYRTFKVYNGVSTVQGTVYDTDYFINSAGVLYESVNCDSRVDLQSDGKIHIATQTSYTESISNGEVFSYAGKQWVYKGVTADGKYYKILPCFPISSLTNVKVQRTAKGVVPILGEDATNLQKTIDAVDQVYSEYFNGLSCESQIDYDNFPYVKDLFGFDNNCSVDEDAWYVLGNTLRSPDGETVQINRNDTTVYSTYRSKSISAIPILYLDVGDYSFFTASDGFHLAPGTLCNVLNLDGIYTTGISQSMTDSILAKYTKTVELNSLIDGQSVFICGIKFTCRTDKSGSKVFVSDPIKDSRTTSSLKVCAKNGDTTSINSKIKTRFVGQRIYYEGLYYNLSSFIQEGSIGDCYESLQSGMLYKSGNKYLIYDGSSSTSDLTTSADYYIMQLKFEDGLLVRPLTSKLADYVLLYRSKNSANSLIDDIPFLKESLSYTEESDYDLTLGKTTYKVSQFFREAKSNFKSMMHKAFIGDLMNLMWFIVFAFTSYLTIIIWIMYAILHHGLGLKVFETVSLPSNQNGIFRRGFDLIRIFSFGIYNLDSDPTFARTMVTSFVTFFIAFAVAIWIPH